MPAPTPNGPTLNDLEYGSFNGLGSVNVTTYVPTYTVQASENVRLSENIVFNIAGISYSVNTSDFINTAENVALGEDTPGPNVVSVNVSETVVTSENVDVLKAGARNVTVSDTVTTSENITVVEA